MNPLKQEYLRLLPLAVILTVVGVHANGGDFTSQNFPSPGVAMIFERVAQHNFHPIRDGFTYDRDLDTHGVADLADPDWKVRTLAVRDLVRSDELPPLLAGLDHDHPEVRALSAMALGIRRESTAVPALTKRLASDPQPNVRANAAIALGHIGDPDALPALRIAVQDAPDKDTRHQAQLSLHAIETRQPATEALAAAWRGLDPDTFAAAEVGKPAPDFTLPDTEAQPWKLSDLRGDKAVALIWIFADWCPVCHGEFRDLIDLRGEFERAGIQPVTLECHDSFRARVMVGKEFEPDYWFSDKPFHESYTENIWWPHLVDRAAAVGVKYDVQPMAFSVHAETINRPTVALIDKEGILRFLYHGTYWGDRPTLREIFDMMKSGDYTYAAPKRLQPADASPPKTD